MLDNLVADVYRTIRTEGWMDDVLRQGLSEEVSRRIQGFASQGQGKIGLRLSQLGPRCPRALWFHVNRPDLAEPLPPPAQIKYSYGHLIEALAITLARAAGYTVEGEQDEIFVDGVPGHRDCVINGCVVDVKSASSLSFLKFESKAIAHDDPFGYLEQIDGYVVGSLDDPIVKVKDRGYIWAIDKTLGKMVLYEHRTREDHIRSRIADYRSITSSQSPPPCTCETVTDRTTRRLRLGTAASYSSYKHLCFPKLKIELDKGKPKFYVN